VRATRSVYLIFPRLDHCQISADLNRLFSSRARIFLKRPLTPYPLCRRRQIYALSLEDPFANLMFIGPRIIVIVEE